LEIHDLPPDYSKMNDCYPLLSESSTFKDVMKALSQPGVHRVPMTGKAKFRQEILGQKEKRPLERFFTQSDLLRFVASNLDSFGDIVDKSVGDRLGSRPVFCVSEGVKVIEAFRELVSRKVTALGVVDDKGLLIGNISVRDMRYVVKQTPGAELVAPLDEFYTQVRKANPEIPKDVIACKEDETVKSVIVKLDSNHIHRIYIIDDEQKPVGVISLGDIFQYLLDNLK
jgi:CBS domain-containing protein